MKVLRDVGSIAERGYAIIPDVISTEEISALLSALETSAVLRSRAGVRHALTIPEVASLAEDSRLLRIARRVLGEGAIPLRAALFDKSPVSNWLVVWHQDTALPLPRRVDADGWGPWSVKEGRVYAHAPASALEQILALRLHLDDSTEQNGPLRVLPGTHTLGVLTDDAIRELVEKIRPYECVAPRGGILAMRPLIVHASSKSQSANYRRVLHIEYASSSMTPDGIELAVP